MGRPARFSADQMLDVARRLVAEGGVQSLTMSAVANELAAPSGSIYHRFPSRDHLAAELWLRTVERFQAAFISQIDQQGDAMEVAASIARRVVEWAADHPNDAALLTQFRRHQLISGDVPSLASRAKLSAQQLDEALARLADRLDRPLDLVRLAVAGIPYAAVRPSVGNRRPVPDWAADSVERAVRALLADPITSVDRPH